MLDIRDHGGQYGGGKYRKNSIINEDSLKKEVIGGTQISKTLGLGGTPLLSDCVAVSGDGKKMAARNQGTNTSLDRLFIYDNNGVQLNAFKDEQSIGMRQIALNYDGSKLYVLRTIGSLTVYNTLTGAVISNASLPSSGNNGASPSQIKVLPDDSYIYLYTGTDLANLNVAKRDASHNLIWSKISRLVGTSCFLIHPVSGDIIIGGTGNSSTPSSVTIICYNSAGEERWTKTYSTTYGTAMLSYDASKNHIHQLTNSNRVVNVFNATSGTYIGYYTLFAGSEANSSNPIRFDEFGNYFIGDSTKKAEIVKYDADRVELWKSVSVYPTSNTANYYVGGLLFNQSDILAIPTLTSWITRYVRSNGFKILD